MDYSTISNKTTFTEAEDITNGELSERYYLLKKQFESLSVSYEATKQELHDTRRSYQTALDVQGHLNAELESFQAEEEKRRSELTSRITTLQEEISALREERSETAESHASEIKKLEADIRRLKEDQAIKVQIASPEKDNTELDEAKTALNDALCDATAAKSALEDARAEIASWKMRAKELVSEMAEMRAASELRREELRAAGEREATALAELAEARAMLHQCSNPDDLQPHAAKGNSIFAEVEDKRQEMAKNLIHMKQTNSRLRRELANKQSELEALLHEKQTIWEQQAGSAAHYDRELIDNYEERITQLEGLCERQRREQSRWFGKLCEPTAQGWLPGVLEHLKSECENLRAEVLSRGTAQLASAAQVRDLRRKLALATASAAKLTASPLAETNGNIVKAEIPVKMPAKPRPTPDDVKKKVSFN
ncbi:protein Spindly [Pectinophora gossypiella]|uniref:protein Spindly n=1 Tax=Pectinophora gossypiella TaxID=13191 RepID=UPI00214E8F7C|nr:protein Spindly [Pectinophora gossypiella]